MESKLTESAWKRGFNDTKLALGSIAFIITDIISGVSTTVLGHYFCNQWYIGVLVSIAIPIVIWIWATATAPINQRNESRSEMKILRNKLGDHIHNENLVDEIALFIVAGTDLLNKIKGEYPLTPRSILKSNLLYNINRLCGYIKHYSIRFIEWDRFKGWVRSQHGYNSYKIQLVFPRLLVLFWGYQR